MLYLEAGCYNCSVGEGAGHARAFDYAHAAADVRQIVDEAIRYPGVRDGYVASLEQQAADAVLHDPAQVVTGLRLQC